jgi:hypothetical protein
VPIVILMTGLVPIKTILSVKEGNYVVLEIIHGSHTVL